MINNDANSRNRESLLGCRVVMMTAGLFTLLSQKEPISKITEYSVFRKLTSLETAVFELTLANVFYEATEIDLDSLSKFWYDLEDKPSEGLAPTAAEYTEYKASIAPFVGQLKAREAARHYLFGTRDPSDCEVVSIFELHQSKKDKHYKILTSAGNVYIIVEEGFLKWLEDASSKLEFYSDVLKAMYGLGRINNVNGTAWYSKYLEVLCGLV